MRILHNQSTNPYFNLAAEEYLLKHCTDDVFMLWRNGPSVIVGRHQNAIQEVNLDYIDKHDIPVVRRLSGGGAVFHDLGNINFTFIQQDDGDSFHNFKRFTAPILQVLNNLGVSAVFSGRNDLTINGRKFSGNAQFKYKDRILHHGTLLFSSQMTDLSAALNPKPAKFKGKSVQSVRSRVTNISEHLQDPLSIEAFIQAVEEQVQAQTSEAQRLQLTPEEEAGIAALQERKYDTWSWNFGSSPHFAYSYEEKLPAGSVQICFNVEQGIMKDVRIYGDFFSRRNLGELERKLTDIPHKRDDVQRVLASVEVDAYIAGASAQDLLSMIY